MVSIKLVDLALMHARALRDEPIVEKELPREFQDQVSGIVPSDADCSKHAGDQVEDECFVCMRAAERRCSRCKKYALCSLVCEEKMDYVRHTFSCPSTQRPSTDFLCLAVLEDELPDDPETCEDFGSSSFWDSHDRAQLFGLYVEALNVLKVPPRTIAHWVKEGTLNEIIVKEYNVIPDCSRGDYYPWFLKHRHIIEKRIGENDVMTRFLGKIQPYLEPHDKKVDMRRCQPEAKRQGFEMYVMALNHNHPAITRKEWYLFGFCRTVDELSERRLEVYMWI